LLAHVQLFIHWYPQVLLGRAALNPFVPQRVLMPGVALTQMQDLALGHGDESEMRMRGGCVVFFFFSFIFQ